MTHKKNVYVDTSGYLAEQLPELFQKAISTRLQDSIKLLASEWYRGRYKSPKKQELPKDVASSDASNIRTRIERTGSFRQLLTYHEEMWGINWNRFAVKLEPIQEQPEVMPDVAR